MAKGGVEEGVAEIGPFDLVLAAERRVIGIGRGHHQCVVVGARLAFPRAPTNRSINRSSQGSGTRALMVKTASPCSFLRVALQDQMLE
jgi:hypothetical protein